MMKHWDSNDIDLFLDYLDGRMEETDAAARMRKLEGHLLDCELCSNRIRPIMDAHARLMEKFHLSNPEMHPDYPKVSFREQLAPEPGITRLSKNNLLDSDKVLAVPMGLDNQYVPATLLNEAVKNHISLRMLHESGIIQPYIRNEYLRSLINVEGIVVNRAFLYNNYSIAQDYINDMDSDRSAFKRLVSDGAIIPYFFKEKDFGPKSTENMKPKFDFELTAYGKLQDIMSETSVQVLRLDWDDKQNNRAIEDNLSARFTTFCQGLANYRMLVEEYADIFHLSNSEDFINAVDALSDHAHDTIREKRNAGSEDKSYTREEFYKRFVVKPGTTVSDGEYDSSKPFVSELKRLVDLVYGLNLPDALGVYALSPADALQRSVVQSFYLRKEADRFRNIDPSELARQLAELRFETTQKGLSLHSIKMLTLRDIVEIRKFDSWHNYIHSVRAMLNKTNDLQTEFAAMRDVYLTYARLGTDIVKYLNIMPQRTKTDATTLQMKFGEKRLSVVYYGGDIYVKTDEPYSVNVPRDEYAAFSCLTSFGGNALQRDTYYGLGADFEVMGGKLRNSQASYEEARRRLMETGKAKEWTNTTILTHTRNSISSGE